ncbi:hypothetical protein MMC18_003036 [Xylographa bjoerkii]|nr:hypothetical protein [Xylographa bjoerkii]
MKTDFQFSNLLGTVYCKGNLLFTPDGTCLLSPVGNRVTVFDLVNNKSYTLPFAHRRNISRIALTPRGNLLLSVDEEGHAVLTNFPRRLALHHFSFKGAVSALAFSPTGGYFAVGLGRFVEVWHTPSTPDSNTEGELEFAPFVKHRVYAGHYDTVESVEWSSDSRFFLSSAKDLTAKIWSLNPEEGFVPTTLAGHREDVLGAWFSGDQESIYTISRDGALFRWAYVPRVIENGNIEEESTNDEDSRWRIVKRDYFLQYNAKVNCATYHASSDLIVVGFSNGIFGLYEVPDFNMIHTLSISQSNIDFVSINKSGEWLAFGASKLGQLLVWEWQSESYILKQQGHFDSINSLVYSPDGQQVTTTADDGKIKVWDVQSGFCIVTFTEHSAAVTACEFSKRGKVLFTASLDGSVRAWDLIRYRNFRTFTAPTRLPFSSIAVDPSGEVICAGSVDSFDIHIWSVQTGQLLDQLAGHEGPVSSLAFAPSGGIIISGSWDHTVRIWNIFARTQTSESLLLQADVLDLAVRPDSKQVAVSTLDGQLTFWSISEGSQETGVDGRRDVSGGRQLTDRRTAANAAGSKAFNSIAFSVDGSCILAGGNSKYICLYDVQSGTLVKKFTVSINLALDGTQEYLNSRNLTEAGPAGLIDTQGEASDLEDRLDKTLPGASRGDLSVRRTRPQVRVTALAFSPTARSFCAASTEGLLIYSLDNFLQFDPFDLDLSITPASTLETLSSGDYLRALVMAFRLNERSLIRRVYEGIPMSDICFVVKEVPTVYLARLLRFVAQVTDESPHLEFNLLWIEALLSQHGRYLKESSGSFAAELRSMQKAVARIQQELTRMADDNIYALDYLLAQPVMDQKVELLENQGVENSLVKSDLVMNGNGDTQSGVHSEDEWIGLD